MTSSKPSRTAVGAAIGTAITIALSTLAFTPAFADTVAPTVTWSIADGTTYVYGKVPVAVPTCAATTTDATVAAITCDVDASTYLATVGTHTLAATVTETLADTSVVTVPASISYTVQAWTLKGFYAPVKPGVNTKKAGSTVPLKFKVYEGTKRAKSKSVIDTFIAQKVDCTTAAPIDAPKSLLTGTKGHGLKYYGKAFHLNWKTPKLAVTKVKGKKVTSPACYLVTMTTDDGSALTANFLLK